MMNLLKTIDGLLVGTKYLAWAIALVGIPVSAVLVVANLAAGFAAVMVCLAAFLLSVGVTLLLLPKQLAKGILGSKKRMVIGAVVVVLAGVIMGISYFSAGAFPELNLLFV